MNKGKPDLGAVINPEKTLSNTKVSFEQGSSVANVVSHQFPWCGMLLNSKTGSVSVDYSRFSDGKALDGLTVDRSKAEGIQMKFRMQTLFVRPRCAPIFYDPFINDFDSIVKNFYQMMLFGAVKTACYLRGYDNQRNDSYTMECIRFLSIYAVQLVRSGLNDASQKLVLTESAASWLSWRAFHDTFSRLHDFEGLTFLISEVLDRKESHQHLLPTISRALEEFNLRRMIRI